MVKVDGKAKRGRPTKDVKKSALLAVRLEPVLLARIEAAARRSGVSRSEWLRLSAAALIDSPADLARAFAVDPSAERTRLVVRERSQSGKRVGDGSTA
jgi:hypothetical protein